jgi:patched 1 protein
LFFKTLSPSSFHSIWNHLFSPWKLKDICYSLNAPDIEEYNVLQVIEKLLPCAIATPLDCFWEGAKLLGPDDDLHVPGFGHVRWTNLNPGRLLHQLASGNGPSADSIERMSNAGSVSLHSLTQMLQRGGVSAAYQDKPCLDPTDEECPATAPNKNSTLAPDVASALAHGCSGFATKWMHWPQPLLLGGVRRNRTNRLSHASALQSVLQLMSESDLFEFYRNHFKVLSVDWTLDKARQVLDAWQRQLTEQLRQWKATTTSSNQFDLHQFTPVALIDSMRRYETLPIVSAATAIACLLLHLLFTLSRSRSPDRSNQSDSSADPPTPQSSCWLAVPCLFILLLTFASSFGVSALIGIPFSSTTSCLTPFVAVALIALPLHHMIHSYLQVCAESQSNHPIASTQLLSHVLSRTICLQSLITVASLLCLSIAVIIPVPALRQLVLQLLLSLCFTFLTVFLLFPALLALDFVKRSRFLTSSGSRSIDRSTDVNKDDSLKLCKSKLAQVAQSDEKTVPPIECSSNRNSCAWFQFILKRKMLQFSAFLFTVLLTIFCLLGLFALRDGLELSDVVPRSTEEHQFLRAQQQHLGVFHMHVVTNGRFDYPQNQRLLQQLHDAIGKLTNVVRRADQRPIEFWLHLFRDWLRSLQDTFDREMSTNRVHADGWHRNASVDAILAYKLLVQTGRADRPVDRRLISKRRRLVDENGLITARPFYNYLTAWVNSDAITYSASQAAFKPEPKQWTHEPSDHDLRIPRAQQLQYSQMPFLLQQLDTSERVLQTIEQVKGVCSRYARLGLHSFPIGLPFLFWQQFHLLRYLLFVSIAFGIVVTAVLVAGISRQLQAVAIPILLLVLFNVQLVGMIARLRLQLNAVPAVVVIIANVTFIQSVLYQTSVFLSCNGTNEQRTLEAMRKSRSVLMHKTITIAIVVGVLSISEFDYIFK